MIDNLTKENFTLLSAKYYNVLNLLQSEFEEDLKHIKYIKKLFQKYRSSNQLKERLILNHIICLSNVFGVEYATRLLFFKCNKEDYDILKTFLIALDYLPNTVKGIEGVDIETDFIPVDLNAAKWLRIELA